MNSESNDSRRFGLIETIVLVAVAIVVVILKDIVGLVYGLAFAVIIGGLAGLLLMRWGSKGRLR
jgi:hypothetical protein